MTLIPRSALILGMLGLLPFFAGAVVSLGMLEMDMGNPDDGGYPLIVAADGPRLLLDYGKIILAFMSGVLWGFATKATGQKATFGYILSVIPALWVFFFTGGPTSAAIINLIVGFLGLLVLDWCFWREKLAPSWWMHLRLILTSGVIICLLTAVI